MKRIVAILLASLFLISLIPLYSHAVSAHIIDEGDLLSSDDLSKVETKLAEDSDASGIDILVLIVDGTNGKDLSSFAEDAFHSYFGDTEDAAFLLLDLSEGDVLLRLFGNAENLRDSFNSILYSTVAVLRERSYSDGFIAFSQEVRKSCDPDYVPEESFPVASVNAAPHIIDAAGLLSADELTEVESELAEASNKAGIDIFVYTVYSTGTSSVSSFANETLENAFGYVDDGALLLIAMEDRDWSVSLVGDAERIDGYVDSIADAFKPDLSEGRYSAAFISYARATQKSYLDSQKLFKFSFTSIGVPLVVAFIISLVIVGAWKGQLKSARFHNAGCYLKQGSLNLTQCVDLFLYSSVTKTRKESSSSGGGGSRTSSSGRSHSGHGGKF